MTFDSFSRPEEWDIINFRLRNELLSLNQIRSYINPYLATHDLLISLAQLYAHKRSVAWVTGVSPLLENSQPHFVRESYQIQNLRMEEIINAGDQGQSAIEKLNKDTLFLVFFKNHALTGESYAYEKIEEWATSRKIIFILISHEFDSGFKIGTGSMGIQVVDKSLSLVYLPERSKLLSALGAFQNIKWNDSWSVIFKEKAKKKVIELGSLIATFENSLTQKKWTFLGQKSNDRSLLIFENIHSDYIVEKFKQNGFKNVKSFSDCFSNSPRSIRRWIQPEISDQILRGLVQLSFETPKDIPTAAMIDDIVNSIKNDSQWTF